MISPNEGNRSKSGDTKKRCLPRKGIVTICSVLAVTLSLAACGTSGPSSSAPKTQSTKASGASGANVSATAGSCTKTATPITFWSWVPGIGAAVNLFNRTHPSVCVELTDVGSGTSEYDKLNTALTAGTGAPDVVQIGDDVMSQYILEKRLVNIAPYGAASVKSDYGTAIWSDVTSGSRIYGIPQDDATYALLYNAKLFHKYHLAIPRTWAQYAAEAKVFKADDPAAYFGVFTTNTPSTSYALMSQAGALPYAGSHGTILNINYASSAAKRWASYWQQLVNSHDIATGQAYTNVFTRNLVNGTYATWIMAAWGPDVVETAVPATDAGAWRVAPEPQWSARTHVYSDAFGGTDALTVQSKHRKLCAEFAMWLNTSKASWKLMAAPPISLFPADIRISHSGIVTNQTISMTGNQKIYNVYVDEQTGVPAAFRYPPVQLVEETDWNNAFLKFPAQGSIASDMLTVQGAVAEYARGEGFTVHVGR